MTFVIRTLRRELRRLLRMIRSTRGRVAVFASPYCHGLHYLWHLLVWSRISAGRAGLLSIELPLEMLSRKGVRGLPPRLEARGSVEASVFSQGFAEIYAVLFANLQQADLLSPYRYAIPGPAFRGVYLWDSAFIAQVWTWWDLQVAREVLLSVVELRDGDRLQHVVTELSQSRYTQPPLIAWSGMAIARMSSPAGARAFLERLYRPLRAYQRWLETHRRLENGLYGWAHPYESGVENAPRFSNRDESVLRNTQAVGAPDFCTYVVLQLEALSEMAHCLGRPEEAQAFAAKAQRLRDRMNALLWDERDGLYYDLDAAGMPVRVSTVASLLPLWAGVPDAERARRLLARILDPRHYGSLIPIPSVGRAEHCFEKDMWRGPVWVNTAYGVMQGLLRYGFEREAGELAFRLCRGVYRVFSEERQVYEFYDPDAFHTKDLRRKRGNWWKAMTLGRGPQRDFVGWSGLVNTLVIEVLLGLSLRQGRLTLRPRLPPACVGMTLALVLHQARRRLSLSCVSPDRFEVTWDRDGDAWTFPAGFAEPVDLGRFPE